MTVAVDRRETSAFRRLLAGTVAILVLSGWAAAESRAADTIYVSNDAGDIRSAPLDGGGPLTTLYTGLGPVSSLKLNPADDALAWVQFSSGIRTAPIAGGGSPTTVQADPSASGVVVDPAADRLYWTNGNNEVRTGPLSGGAASTLYTDSLQLRQLTIDRDAGRVYWVSANTNQIFGAPLDGSGPIVTLYGGSPTVNGPYGIALDVEDQMLYWTNAVGGTVMRAPASGTAGGGVPEVLFSGQSGPRGIAVDPDAGKVYWVNFGSGEVSTGPMDGGSATPLYTGQTSLQGVTVLRAPASAAPPPVTGTGAIGQQLTCDHGIWESKGVSTFTYNAPSDFSYQWRKDGSDIAGATDATYTPEAGGSYTCRVSASNAAGETMATSPVVDVPDPTPPPLGPQQCRSVGVTASKYKPGRSGGSSGRRVEGVRARITVIEPASLEVAATLLFKLDGKLRSADLGTRTVKDGGRRNLRLPLPRKLRRQLTRGTRVTVRLDITGRPDATPDCTDPASSTHTVHTKIARVRP